VSGIIGTENPHSPKRVAARRNTPKRTGYEREDDAAQGIHEDEQDLSGVHSRVVGNPEMALREKEAVPKP
jgi:hypothetical protein